MENRLKSPSSFLSFTKTVTSSPRNSVIRDMTNLASTSPSSFKRSIISTSKSKNDQVGSTEKSKIKSLPNYEKYSLGNNLPFVTVFQTIEIERLSQEIETQRIKLKQYERMIFNANNFEVQIKELTEKCSAHEEQVNEYRDELDKMNKICQSLYHENENLKNKGKNIDSVNKSKLEEECKKNKELHKQIERWTQKYQLNEQNKMEEIEQMRSMMQRQRKSMIDREIKDIKIRHSAEIANLTQQIRRLNHMLLSKEKYLQDVLSSDKQKYDQIKQMQIIHSKINDYEEKLCTLNQQNLRLSRLVDEKTSELDTSKKNEFKLNQRLKTQRQSTLEHQQLQNLVDQKQKQVQQWKSKTYALQHEVTKGKELMHINEELSTKNKSFGLENDKLVKLLKERSAEIQKWKSTALSLQQDSQRARQFQDLLVEKQLNLSAIQAENERLQGVNRLRFDQLEELKSKYKGSQSETGFLSKIEKQKLMVEQKYKGQSQRMAQMQKLIEQIQMENGNLKHIQNRERQTQLKIQNIKKENDRLQIKITECTKQISQLKYVQSKFDKQNIQNKQNQNILTNYENKIKILNQQIQSLITQLKTKNQQISALEDSQISNFALANQCKSLNNNIQEKQRAIQKMKVQIEQYENKIQQYEAQMEEIDQKNKDLFSKINEQFQQTQDTLRLKQKQCHELKAREVRMQSNLSQMNSLQKNYHKQQNRLTVQIRDIQDMREAAKEYEHSLLQQKHKNKKLEEQINKMRLLAHQQQSLVYKMGDSQRLSSKHTLINGLQPNKLISKIDSLEEILEDLKIKYGNILKQVKGSSSTISVTSSSVSVNQI